MSEAADGDDTALLGELAALRRRARTARHAYWFPLALFGVLTCASVLFYVQPALPAPGGYVSGGPGLPVLGGLTGFLTQPGLGYYWLAALLAGLLATFLWYRWNARRVGLATPVRGSVAIVAALTVLVAVLPALSRVHGPHWPGWLARLEALWVSDVTMRGTFPFILIAVGLWALAWAERSRALTVIAAVYTGTALLASLYNIENVLFQLGWNPSGSEWRLTSLPNVLLPALVLLAAGTGAFAAQRRGRPPAAPVVPVVPA